MIIKNTPLIKPLIVPLIVGCPEFLFVAIDSFHCSPINKEHLKRLIGVMLFELQEGHAPMSFYKVMSKSYLLQVTTDDFKKKMWSSICYSYKADAKNKISETESLIQTDGIFYRSKGKKEERPLHYRINPQLLQGPLVPLEFTYRNSKTEYLNHLFPELIEHFNFSFSKLAINLNLLEKNEAELNISPVHVGEDFAIIVRENDEGLNYSEVESIPPFYADEVKIIGENDITDVHSNFLLQKLQEIRSKHSGEIRIIIDGPDVAIDDLYDYIENRGARASRSYLSMARSINHKLASPTISASNGRLNSPITAFNRIGVKYMTVDGHNITQVDLKSSQVVILTNLMKRPDAFIKSLKVSRNPHLKKYLNCFLQVEYKDYNLTDFLGYLVKEDVYESIAKDLKVIRPMAKGEMFRILFTEPDKGQFNYTIKKQFPDFFAYLKDIKIAFKKRFGNSKSSLAYFLQMVEAHIFLECILTDIANRGIAAFTKHDSILVSSHIDSLKSTIDVIKHQMSFLGLRGQFEAEEYHVIDWTSYPINFNSPEYDLISSYPSLYSPKKKYVLNLDE